MPRATRHLQPCRSTPPTRAGFRLDLHAGLEGEHQAGPRRRRLSPRVARSTRSRTLRAAAFLLYSGLLRRRLCATRTGQVVADLLPRAETRIRRARAPRGSVRCGRLGRSRRFATACCALGGAVDRPAGASDAQALATLRAPALQREPTRPRAHPSAETVRPRSLALLRLVGAFHGSRARGGWRTSIRSEVPNPGAGGRHDTARLFPALCVKPCPRRPGRQKAADIFARLGLPCPEPSRIRRRTLPQGDAWSCPRISSPLPLGARSAPSCDRW